MTDVKPPPVAGCPAGKSAPRSFEPAATRAKPEFSSLLRRSTGPKVDGSEGGKPPPPESGEAAIRWLVKRPEEGREEPLSRTVSRDAEHTRTEKERVQEEEERTSEEAAWGELQLEPCVRALVSLRPGATAAAHTATSLGAPVFEQLASQVLRQVTVSRTGAKASVHLELAGAHYAGTELTVEGEVDGSLVLRVRSSQPGARRHLEGVLSKDLERAGFVVVIDATE